MGTGGIITKNGKNWLLNRAYKEVSDYEEPYYLKVGIGTTTPIVSDTDLEIPVPVEDGIVNDDGSNQLTGSDGGDNTTNNTTTFKEGAGATDETAQNLIANNTSATKRWNISDLFANGNNINEDKYASIWLYIKDQTTYNKFNSLTNALTLRLGSDSSNYYYLNLTINDISVGWNWITSWPDTVADLDEHGTVSGDIDNFTLIIYTANPSQTFSAGDVVYDLLRTYEDDDLIRTLVSGFPTFDTTNKTVTSRGYLTALQGNGFPITEIGLFSGDTTPVMITHDVIPARSKSSTDEFAFNIKDDVE